MKLRFILMSIVLGIFICIVPVTVVHAEDEVSLPKGFVTPQSMFGYMEEYNTNVETVTQLFNYALIDGVYLVFDYLDHHILLLQVLYYFLLLYNYIFSLNLQYRLHLGYVLTIN